MKVSIEDHWEKFVQTAVESGRFAKPDDVVHEGLRLVQMHEAKLAALRAMVAASLADGDDLTDDEVGAYLDATSAELVQEET